MRRRRKSLMKRVKMTPALMRNLCSRLIRYKQTLLLTSLLGKAGNKIRDEALLKPKSLAEGVK